ncbi:hypothetical protein ACFL47_11300 [Candidatus Latescibacterota bacterium]
MEKFDTVYYNLYENKDGFFVVSGARIYGATGYGYDRDFKKLVPYRTKERAEIFRDHRMEYDTEEKKEELLKEMNDYFENVVYHFPASEEEKEE